MIRCPVTVSKAGALGMPRHTGLCIGSISVKVWRLAPAGNGVRNCLRLNVGPERIVLHELWVTIILGPFLSGYCQ